jgi:hypothetical protein
VRVCELVSAFVRVVLVRDTWLVRVGAWRRWWWWCVSSRLDEDVKSAQSRILSCAGSKWATAWTSPFSTTAAAEAGAAEAAGAGAAVAVAVAVVALAAALEEGGIGVAMVVAVAVAVVVAAAVAAQGETGVGRSMRKEREEGRWVWGLCVPGFCFCFEESGSPCMGKNLWAGFQYEKGKENPNSHSAAGATAYLFIFFCWALWLHLGLFRLRHFPTPFRSPIPPINPTQTLLLLCTNTPSQPPLDAPSPLQQPRGGERGHGRRRAGARGRLGGGGRGGAGGALALALAVVGRSSKGRGPEALELEAERVDLLLELRDEELALDQLHAEGVPLRGQHRRRLVPRLLCV